MDAGPPHCVQFWFFLLCNELGFDTYTTLKTSYVARNVVQIEIRIGRISTWMREVNDISLDSNELRLGFN